MKQKHIETTLGTQKTSIEVTENDIRLIEPDQIQLAKTESDTFCILGTDQRPFDQVQAETIRFLVQSFVDYEPFYNVLRLLERLQENADQMLFIEREFRREFGIGYSRPWYYITTMKCGDRNCQFCRRLGHPHSLVWQKAVMRRLEKSDGSIFFRPYLTPFEIRKSKKENGRQVYYYESVYSSKSLPHSFFKSKRMRQTKERFKVYNEAVKQLNRERNKLMRLHGKITKGVSKRVIDSVESPGIDFTQISREQIEDRREQNRQRFKQKRGID